MQRYQNNYPNSYQPQDYNPYQPMYDMSRSSPYQMPMPMPKASFMQNLNQRFGISSMIQTTTKTVRTVNQVIPIIHQVTPLVNNARNAFTLLRALNKIDDIDLSVIDEALGEEIVEEKETELFENML